MTTPLIVEPNAIESELKKIWEQLGKENKMRACLFNLVVFNRYSKRTEYILSIVDKVIEKFPCRLIFISEDQKHDFLKTAVSVKMPCDHIDIVVGGGQLERAPYVVRPHILPDLPVTLLWAEDPCVSHSLFEPLAQMADRVIFDSESADNLLSFSKTVLGLSTEVADLNWARTEGWRDLLCSIFESRVDALHSISDIKIVYNARTTESFCHLKIQSMYLLAWLADRLGWNVKSADANLQFTFENSTASIASTTWEKLGPGTITSVQLTTKDGQVFECARIPDRYHYVNIQISSPEKCDLPYQYVLGQTATGQSLVKEICIKGTSAHYLKMLTLLQSLDKDKLC